MAVRGYLDHVRRDILLSSVTCVFDHVAACHVLFLFLEILRQEAMFFARVKNGRHLKTSATTCTGFPATKRDILLINSGSQWSPSTACSAWWNTKGWLHATLLLAPDRALKYVDLIFFDRVKNMLVMVS